jgi:hypothetical protein
MTTSNMHIKGKPQTTTGQLVCIISITCKICQHVRCTIHWTWHHVVWCKFTDVSEDHNASILLIRLNKHASSAWLAYSLTLKQNQYVALWKACNLPNYSQCPSMAAYKSQNVTKQIYIYIYMHIQKMLLKLHQKSNPFPFQWRNAMQKIPKLPNLFWRLPITLYTLQYIR